MRNVFASFRAAVGVAVCVCAVYSCQKNLTEPTAAGMVSDQVILSKLAVTGITGPTSAQYPLSYLTDGNLNTIWSAETAAGVYLPDANSQIVTVRLDTTVMQTVAYIRLAFFTGTTAMQYAFDVQVSPDGNSGWVTVLTNQHSGQRNSNLQMYDFPDTRGRYVRIVGHGNNGSYPKANSYTELEIYGAPAAPVTSVKVPIKAAQMSASNYITPFEPANAVDGDQTTNWASRMTSTEDYKYITADLGSVRTVDLVKLAFPTGGDPNRVSRFGVFVSTDNINFTKIIAGTYSARPPYGGTLETFDFPDIQARYVRMYSYGHTGTFSPTTNNSISELEVWAQPAENENQFYSPNDARLQYIGRFVKDSARVYQPGAYLSASFIGSDFSVIVEDQKQFGYDKVAKKWPQCNIIGYSVDNGPLTRIKLPNKRDTIQVAKDLPPGPHTIIFVKETEWVQGYLDFKGVICGSLEETTLPAHKILGIGDSQEEGWGSNQELFACGMGEHWSDQHDPYQAFVARIARSTGAQWQLAAMAGIGLIHSTSSLAYTMPQVFDKLRMYDNQQPYNLNEYVPDLVIICLGQNDGQQDSTQFCSAYVNLVRTVKLHYPGTKIICLNAPMAFNPFKALMTKYLTGIVRALNDPSVTTFGFSKTWGTGCANHPTVTEQGEVAGELLPYVKSVVKW